MLMLTAFASSAEIKVSSFAVSDGELTARTDPRRDRNDNLCALIRVAIPVQGVVFEGNVIDQFYHVNEYMVYMTAGTKMMRIRIPDQETLDLRFDAVSDIQALESGTTYSMKLDGLQLPQSGQSIADPGGNYLILDIEPKNIGGLMVRIDGALKQVSEDGTVSGFYSYGPHRYEVEAEGYEPLSGSATVGKGERTRVGARLQSVQAWIDVVSAMPDAFISVNEQAKGRGSWSGTLAPGTYFIEASMPGYRSYKETVTLAKNETRTLKIPALQPIYGMLNVDYSPVDSRIRVDGNDVGQTPGIVNDLIVGTHTVTISKEGYETATVTVTVTEGQTATVTGALKKKMINLEDLPIDELRHIAEMSDSDARKELGMRYYNGKGVTQDYAEALTWFRLSAEQGNAKAMNNIGVMYEYGYGVTQDYAEARKWFEMAAAQNEPVAQANLGTMYSYGWGVPQNFREAAEWYRKSAEQGHSGAQSLLGSLYLEGNGVEKDYAEAFKWFQKSANQGNVRGFDNLGYIYTFGYGVPQDYKEAEKWYRKAAEQGDMIGQYNLGFMYFEGHGVEKDYSEAFKWFLKAANQGRVEAIFNIGAMYEGGYGVDKDLQEAIKWYKKAAAQGGYEKAYEALKRLNI